MVSLLLALTPSPEVPQAHTPHIWLPIAASSRLDITSPKANRHQNRPTSQTPKPYPSGDSIVVNYDLVSKKMWRKQQRKWYLRIRLYKSAAQPDLGWPPPHFQSTPTHKINVCHQGHITGVDEGNLTHPRVNLGYSLLSRRSNLHSRVFLDGRVSLGSSLLSGRRDLHSRVFLEVAFGYWDIEGRIGKGKWMND
jgi:uncharacterized Zn-finger protein